MKGYKRLTERDEFGNADIINVNMPDVYNGVLFDEANILTRALNRFAELEDKIERGESDYVADKDKEIARLTAENAELKATLSKMEKVEKELLEGLEKVVKLKAKVGDTIYLPWEYDGEYDIATLHIKSIDIMASGVFYVTDFDRCDDNIYSSKYNNGIYINTDFETMVFADRAAAEARLAELKGEKDE